MNAPMTTPWTGLKVSVSHILAETYVPVKRHKRRRNDRRGASHRRIQKKWIKRFGTKWMPTAVQVAGFGVFVSPMTWERLKARPDSAENNAQPLPVVRSQLLKP